MIQDLTGLKFGKLVVLCRKGSTQDKRALWLCKCECGNEFVTTGRSLRKGMTRCKNCRNEKLREIRTTHGQTNSRLYHIWRGMKDRCANENSKDYGNYGGRGITVCDEWYNNFQTFYEWAILNGYKSTLTIDRIDVDGNYEPSNCRWATIKEQANNTRFNVYLVHDGRTQTMREWCDELGIDYILVRDRHKVHPEYSFEELFASKQEDKVLVHNGRTQTINEWATELNIPVSTLYNRLYKYGESNVEKVLSCGDKRKTYIEYKGEKKSIKEWCDELGLNYNSVKGRYSKHPEYPPEKLFRKSK